jgi:hypothetical protein
MLEPRMKTWPRTLVCLCLLLFGGSATAQTGFTPVRASVWDPVARFLGPYGLSNFTLFYKRALRAWLRASHRHGYSDHAGAQQYLDNLWLQQPTGIAAWGDQATQPFGLNVGSPPCYYGLRMLSDSVDWRVQSGVQNDVAPRSARLTVLLVGQTHGIEPRDLNELMQGGGVPVTHALDERLLQQGNRVVQQSLELFEEYIFAMTDGNLSVDTRVLHLPALDLEVQATVNQGRFFAGLSQPADVWAALSEEILTETDWGWLIYPSHVPEQYPDFLIAEFVTGGMGTGADGLSPLFLIDDRWLLRKPPHLGSGDYSVVERKAYLPQWLQHEFFHHLFRTYPEFGLEATPHQWFDLSTWPADFEGRYEADYFHEAIFKRLKTADPPLHVALRYATADAPWQDLVLADVLGSYQREPVENNWHIGTIQQVAGTTLKWTNNAGVSWLLDADLSRGELLTGPDCPYYAPPAGTEFQVVLERDSIGDLTSTVLGFAFNGELYERQ